MSSSTTSNAGSASTTPKFSGSSDMRSRRNGRERPFLPRHEAVWSGGHRPKGTEPCTGRFHGNLKRGRLHMSKLLLRSGLGFGALLFSLSTGSAAPVLGQDAL